MNRNASILRIKKASSGVVRQTSDLYLLTRFVSTAGSLITTCWTSLAKASSTIVSRTADRNPSCCARASEAEGVCSTRARTG